MPPKSRNGRIPPNSRRYISALAVLLVAVVAAACGSGTPSGAPASAPAGSSTPGQVVKASNAAPSFTAETYAHGTYDLDSRVGNPVLINFWFPSCPPCRAELPDLQAAYEEYGDSVDFIGIQQTSIETAAEGIAFLRELGVTYPNFADETDSSVATVQLDYRVLGFPTTVFLNRDHSISRTWSTLITKSDLRKQIEIILAS